MESDVKKINLDPVDDLTSTSSDSLDISSTWTVVTNKEIKSTNFTNSLNAPQNQDIQNHVEILNDETKENQSITHSELNGNKEESDEANATKKYEDSSDEISIISECESTDQMPTILNLKDRLQHFNLQFATKCNSPSNVLISKQGEVIETVDNSALTVDTTQQLRRRCVFSEKHKVNTNLQVSRQAELKPFSRIVLNFKTILQSAFYVAMVLAMSILLIKIYNTLTPSISNDLKNKIDNMELQNNLMRGEIDLLNKQIKYLFDVNDMRQQSRDNNNYKFREKHNKGNHKTHDKQKRVYKNWPNDDVEDIIKTKVPCDPSLEASDICVQKYRKKSNKRSKNYDDYSEKRVNGSTQNPQEIKAKKNSNKNGKMYTKEQSNTFKQDANNRDYKSKQYDTNFKENIIHKERKQKDEKRADKYYKENDNEWHTNYMKNRENARIKNERQYDNERNWYIKRGSGRQDKRLNDDHYH